MGLLSVGLETSACRQTGRGAMGFFCVCSTANQAETWGLTYSILPFLPAGAMQGIAGHSRAGAEKGRAGQGRAGQGRARARAISAGFSRCRRSLTPSQCQQTTLEQFAEGRLKRKTSV